MAEGERYMFQGGGEGHPKSWNKGYFIPHCSLQPEGFTWQTPGSLSAATWPRRICPHRAGGPAGKGLRGASRRQERGWGSWINTASLQTQGVRRAD